MRVRVFTHEFKENVLIELTSHRKKVKSIRLFDGEAWHVAPLTEWEKDDNWEQQFDVWHNAIVENA